jgi:hypothetical protein
LGVFKKRQEEKRMTRQRIKDELETLPPKGPFPGGKQYQKVAKKWSKLVV